VFEVSSHLWPLVELPTQFFAEFFSPVKSSLSIRMASVIVARSDAESWRSLSSKYAMVAARADSSLARPGSVRVSVMRRRSSRSVRRLTNPRTTNPSTSADMVGRVNPMWSHTSDSDAPSFLYTKANVRYCGTDISLAPYFRNSARITRKTMGTPSRISCAHSPTVDRIVLACIFLCQSNCLKHELFTANGWFLFKKS